MWVGWNVNHNIFPAEYPAPEYMLLLELKYAIKPGGGCKTCSVSMKCKALILSFVPIVDGDWLGFFRFATRAVLLSAQNSVDDDSDLDLEPVSTSKVDKDGKFSNWASTSQSTPAKVFTPKTAEDVQAILAEVCSRREPFRGQSPFFLSFLSSSSPPTFCQRGLAKQVAVEAKKCRYWWQLQVLVAAGGV